MENTRTLWKPALIAAAAMLTTPAVMLPQSTKDQLTGIQRDIAQLQEQMRQLQKAQADQIGALTQVVQQAVDDSRKTNAMVGGMQRSVDQKLTDLQSKLIAPMASMGSKVDEMSGEFRAMQAGLAELSRILKNLDTKVTEINTIVRTPRETIPVPPPPQGNPACAGASATSLYENAYRDYMAKKDELALQQFNEYLKCFEKTEKAPDVQFYIGNLYDRANQYDDAAQAFDAVLTKFPENPRTPDAMYMKGVMLDKGRHRTDAGQVYREFINRYPSHPQVARAREHLKTLGLSPSGSTRPPGSRKKSDQ